MFAFKNKYFFIIENTKDIELSNIKKSIKFNIIYRNQNKPENMQKLLKFRSLCKRKKIKFFVSNNFRLAVNLKADGAYISSNNKSLKVTQYKRSQLKIIGSAHNLKELNLKILQGCSDILFSRLFKTSYSFKPGFLGIVKYNLLSNLNKANLVPLGGIRLSNLNKLKTVKCNSFAILSEIKKKPAKIINRLF